MFPLSSFDKTECLESLIGIRTGCTVDKEYPFFIEDIEGVDVPKLSKLAKASNLNGKDFAKQLINSASRELLADIELMLNDGYQLKAVAGDMCSNCNLLPTYTVNSGIVIKPNMISRFKNIHITRLSILINRSGAQNFILDDGITPKLYTANFTAGMVVPVNMNYWTGEKSVKLTFEDPTIGLGRVSCSTESGCGCGGSKTAVYPFTFSGVLNGNEVSTQYGFLACAAITCSYDSLVCNLIKLTPNVFGQTLMFKVGEKYYLHKAASDRNNEAASFNEEEKSEFVRNYGALYSARMYGKSDRQAVRNLINDYLKNNKNDSCITCESKMHTAYVTG